MSSIARGHTEAPAGSHAHYEPQVLTQTHGEIARDVLARSSAVSGRYKLLLLLFGGLFVLGIAGFAIRLADGFDAFSPWAYFAATAAWVFTVGATAPVLAITQRMTRSHWRRPITRVSEIFAVVGVLSALMYIPLIVLLPTSTGRRSVWFEFQPDHAWSNWFNTPFWPDLLAVVFLAVLGLGLLYACAVPDLAAIRDHGTGWRQRWAARLSGFWRGTPRQWQVQVAGIRVLGALYFLFVVFVHMLIPADFAEALVPGWKDAILPAYHALSGLQSAVAICLVALFILHKWGGFKDYIHVDQFWAASKIMLALSLLWMYFWFSGFIVYWYGRQPVEENVLRLLMFEPYRWAFVLSVILNFGVPLGLLIWNFVRRSIAGPALVGLSILAGTLFDRIRLYVASFSVADARPDALGSLHPKELDIVPGTLWPHGPDYMIIIGGIAGVIFLFMLVIKFIPALSIWEVGEGLLYRKRVPFLKRTIMVMGKPE